MPTINNRWARDYVRYWVRAVKVPGLTLYRSLELSNSNMLFPSIISWENTDAWCKQNQTSKSKSPTTITKARTTAHPNGVPTFHGSRVWRGITHLLLNLNFYLPVLATSSKRVRKCQWVGLAIENQ